MAKMSMVPVPRSTVRLDLGTVNRSPARDGSETAASGREVDQGDGGDFGGDAGGGDFRGGDFGGGDFGGF
jgi:hypothetical protein